MEVDVVSAKIESDIYKRLSISNIPIRKQLHLYLLEHNFLNIIQAYVDIHTDVTATRKSQNTNTSTAKLMFEYFTRCRQQNDIIIRSLLDTMQENNFELGNFPSVELHASVLLNCYTVIALKSINHSINLTSTVDHERSSLRDETDSSLFRLGGGTLGEIINLCKKRIKMKQLFKLQRKQANDQLHFAKQLCMTREEKTSLPAELKNRDRGGMYFPIRGLLTFIRLVNCSTLKYANKEAFKKYGHDVLKVISS